MILKLSYNNEKKQKTIKKLRIETLKHSLSMIFVNLKDSALVNIIKKDQKRALI
jgi:hypothetical protein